MISTTSCDISGALTLVLPSMAALKNGDAVRSIALCTLNVCLPHLISKSAYAPVARIPPKFRRIPPNISNRVASSLRLGIPAEGVVCATIETMVMLIEMVENEYTAGEESD